LRPLYSRCPFTRCRSRLEEIRIARPTMFATRKREIDCGLLAKSLIFQWPMLFLQYYLWIAPHLLLGWTLVASFRRGMHRRLPIFFAYAAFEMFQFLTLLALSLLSPFPRDIYNWTLVLETGISSCLMLAVIYELANTLLLTQSSRAELLRPLLRWTLVVLMFVAAVSSAALSGATVRRVTNIFQVLDFSSSLVEVGMLVTLFLFSRTLHISWRNRATGVALGFGISACINLATTALRSGLGKSAFIAVDITQMAAFHVCVLVWLVYLYLPNRALAFAGSGLGKSDIQFWDQELQRITGR